MEASTIGLFTTVLLIMGVIAIILWGSRSRKAQCMNCRKLYYPENSTAAQHYTYSFHSEDCRLEYNRNYLKIHGR